MAKPRILLIDDDEAFLDLFVPLVEAQSLEPIPIDSATKALELLDNEQVDLIISDVQMPGMSGIDLFNRIQDLYPDVPMILMTAFGSTEQAIRAVKQGAFHYFEKPFYDRLDLFWATVREALAKSIMLKELASLQREKSLRMRTPMNIVGQSEAIKVVLAAIDDVANLPATVLVSGETGTGKELVARAIHELSDRRDRPLFAINCTEFAPGVLESELFGHEKGAFTGAISRKKGLFEMAHQTTLLLDEISEASAPLQSKLLRVLETKSFMRVGGSAPIYSDFRIIAATNRNLEAEVTAGNFRQDLYYRLNVYSINIPPLRERREDVPLLAEAYLNKYKQLYHKNIQCISSDGMLALKEYEWPGNVRELINVIERAVITCQNSKITTKHLPFRFEKEALRNVSDLNLKDAERFCIELALRRTSGNKTKASEILGISRKTLIEKVKLYAADKRPES